MTYYGNSFSMFRSLSTEQPQSLAPQGLATIHRANMTREVTRNPNGCPDHKLNSFELYPQIINRIYTINPQHYPQAM